MCVCEWGGAGVKVVGADECVGEGCRGSCEQARGCREEDVFWEKKSRTRPW